MTLQTGDRILVNSESFLSKAIRYFMRVYAKKHKLPTDNIYSHAGTIIILNGVAYVAESVENGFRIRHFESRYGSHGSYIIVRPKQEYSNIEKDIISDYAIYLQEVNNFYQYWAFLQWIVYICLGINTFGKGNKFSNYCYEGAYRIAKFVRPDMYPLEPEVITCFDLYNKDIEEIIFESDATEEEKL